MLDEPPENDIESRPCPMCGGGSVTYDCQYDEWSCDTCDWYSNDQEIFENAQEHND